MTEQKHKESLPKGSARNRKEKSMLATGMISVRSGLALLTLVALFLISAVLIVGNSATNTQVGGITVERTLYDQNVNRISDGFSRN